jgi:hypothetical protein
MYKEGPVGLEHEEAYGLGQPCREAARVLHLTASDEETHLGTVLSVSDSAGIE